MMKKLTIFLMAAFLLAIPLNVIAQQTIYGDVNNDLEVNIADINAIINVILNGTGFTEVADVNNDCEINIADINTVINIILNPSENLCDWVDLGLPSGTLWATKNVGASSPEDYGTYFAWGETTSKEIYNWETYKWCNGSDTTMIKYCTISRDGIVDNKTILDLEDDAAYVNMNGLWRMPSNSQMWELTHYCTCQWTSRNNINGLLVISPNGNSLFLPAAGLYMGNTFYHEGIAGYYWVYNLGTRFSSSAFFLEFGSYWVSWGTNSRRYGSSIRPVRYLQD